MHLSFDINDTCAIPRRPVVAAAAEAAPDDGAYGCRCFESHGSFSVLVGCVNFGFRSFLFLRLRGLLDLLSCRCPELDLAVLVWVVAVALRPVVAAAAAEAAPDDEPYGL